MLKAVDCRIFGGISTAENNTAQITGPVQFMNLNQALNRVPIRPNQNTTVFESSMDKEQGSIGTNGLIDFSLNQIIGEVNPFLALKTGLVEKECSWFISSLFDAVNNVTSKSKFGQTSRLLLKINLKNPVHKLADLSEKVQIKDPNNTSYRSVSEVIWDFSRLVKVVAGDHVENVQYRAEDSVEAIFMEQMSSVKDKLVKF
jgi:CRISPR-associated protein Csh2